MESELSATSLATTGSRDLSGFSGRGYDKGRSRPVQAAWFIVMNMVFKKWWCPASLRPALLRAFGADVDPDVFIRHNVRVLWPWKLKIGKNSWIGEGVWLLNLEPITIGSNVCISQDAYLIAGSHDRSSVTFEFDNGPISVGDGAWIAIRATILKRVSVGSMAVISANSVVSRDVPAGEVYRP